MERLIPRWTHPDLGLFIIQYFIFIRFTEEVFAEQLFGEEAAHVLHHEVFYRPSGDSYTLTSQFTSILEEKTAAYLGVEVGIQDWRHFAAAMGRRYTIGIMDPEENITTGMDAMAGRETDTSERIYALQPGQVGKINDRTLALFLACARLWWVKMFNLKVEGRVAELADILDPASQVDDLGRLPETAKSKKDVKSVGIDLNALEGIIQTQLKVLMAEQIIPQIKQVLESVLDTKLASREPELTTPRAPKGKGKAREVPMVSFITFPSHISLL